MVEKTSEREVCNACGADVRANALFCYHCGASVESAQNTEIAARNTSSDAGRGDLIEETNGNNPASEFVAEDLSAEEPAVKSSVEILAPLAENAQKSKNEPGRNAAPIKLQTAAALRQKVKPETKAADEIIWEKPPNALNVWFLASAMVLVIFVILVVLTMLYLR